MWRAARTREASLAPTGSEGRHHADHDRLLRLGSTQDRRSVEVDLARREAQSSGVHGLTTAPQAQGAWGGHPLQAPAPSRRTSSPLTSLSVRAAAAGGGSWRCTPGGERLRAPLERLGLSTSGASSLGAFHQSRWRSAAGILAAPCHEPGPTQHLNRKP